MTSQPGQQARPISAEPDGIETFVENPLGKLTVAILTPFMRFTVRKTKDAQGKAVEKTPLDTISGTVWTGIILLVASVIIIRIVVALT